MASGEAGKKKQKMKGKTLALTEFLTDDKGSAGPGPSYVLSNKPLDWASEMENLAVNDDPNEEFRPNFDRSILPTAPKAARGPDVDLELVPTVAPFTAFIGNLPYEADEMRIEDFFKDQKVLNVRLPSDQGRARGFGYVEFADRESLIDALTLNESVFAGRKIRVDLAGQGQSGGDRNDHRDDHRSTGDPDRTEGDWRRRDAPPAPSNDDRSSDRGFGDRYGDRDSRSFGSDRGGDRGGFGDRYGDRDRGFGDRDRGFGDRDRGFGDRDKRFGGDRDFGDRNRDGGRYSDRYGDRDSGRSYGFSDRDGGRDGGRGFGGRDQGGSYGSGYRREGGYDRYGRRERYGDRSERQEIREPSSSDGGKERPRLQLQPRSKPTEKVAAPEPAKEVSRSASIFGSAKPVDTASKEMEIEKRLAQQKVLGDHYKLDEEKENRDYSNRREMSSGSRPRRDSNRSSDGEPKRERHLSNSSGKGIRTVPPPVTNSRTRKDSDLSNHSDVVSDEREDAKAVTPTKKEELAKLVPAPPPKENVWEIRKTGQHSPGSQTSEPQSPPATESNQLPKSPTSPVSPTNAWSKGRPDVRSQNSSPSDNVWSKRQQTREDGGKGPSDGSRGRGRGQGSSGRGRISDLKPKGSRERHIPTSIEEMPKLEVNIRQDWSDKNKFSSLMDEDVEDES
ncbi:eukaryotic translation initiation factor 4B-like [Gigantopelta aegis]|uniref:eukaryotic translation initiation factor 4B-like n=1 Tax=Gigantopelta aegis TaxID=1735272 RepID=UPI001B88C265|nr:eukaryotic translation initiation factor 4B-like [Gigantopelta aegis]